MIRHWTEEVTEGFHEDGQEDGLVLELARFIRSLYCDGIHGFEEVMDEVLWEFGRDVQCESDILPWAERARRAIELI